jgi:O-antigen ligase
VQRFRAFQVVAGVFAATCVFVAFVCFHQGLAATECVGGENMTEEAMGRPDGRPCETALECYGPDSQPELRYRCEHVGLFGTHSVEGRVRYRGDLNDPNEVALVFAAGGISLLIAFMRRKGPLFVGIGALGLTMCVSSILMTQSRGAMLSGAFGLLLLALFFRGRARRRLLTFVAITWILWTLFDRWTSSIMEEQVISEIVARFSGDDVSSLNGRVEIWQQFAEEFWNSPLIGSGYYSTLYTIGSSGHNLILTTVIERGLVGLALSAGILLKAADEVVRGFLRANTPNSKLFFACIGAGGAASLLHLMVEDAFFTQQYIVYSWVALAIVFQAVEVLPEPVQDETPFLSQPTMSYKT